MSTITATYAAPPSLDDYGVRHGTAAELAARVREDDGLLPEDMPLENAQFIGADEIYGETTAVIADVMQNSEPVGILVQIPYEGLEWIGLDYEGSRYALELVGSREQIEAAAAYLANAAAAIQAALRDR